MAQHVLWHPVAKTYVRALDGSGAAFTSQLGQARVFPTLEAAQVAAQGAERPMALRDAEAMQDCLAAIQRGKAMGEMIESALFGKAGQG